MRACSAETAAREARAAGAVGDAGIINTRWREGVILRVGCRNGRLSASIPKSLLFGAVLWFCGLWCLLCGRGPQGCEDQVMFGCCNGVEQSETGESEI